MKNANKKLEMALSCYDNNELLTALRLLEELNQAYPDDNTVLQYLGDTQRLLFMIDEASLNLKQAYRRAEPDKKAFVAGRLGLLASDHRSTFEAEYWFSIATRKANIFIDWILVLRGANLIKMGHISRGIDVLQDALKHEECRELDEVYVHLAIGEQARKNYGKAKEYAQLALEQNENSKRAKKILQGVEALGHPPTD